MLKVGLTGGIGSGKSTVSSILREKNIVIIDADIISREVLNIYPQTLNAIRKEFGDSFFASDGSLMRKKLGDYIFRYMGERKKLENIVIPYITREIFYRIEEYDKKGEKICVVDAPTLIEHKLHEKMDFNILVCVDRETQIDRIKKRDRLNHEQILSRIDAQMPLEEKKKFADFIIDNSAELESTRKQVESIIHILKMYCD